VAKAAGFPADRGHDVFADVPGGRKRNVVAWTGIIVLPGGSLMNSSGTYSSALTTKPQFVVNVSLKRPISDPGRSVRRRSTHDRSVRTMLICARSSIGTAVPLITMGRPARYGVKPLAQAWMPDNRRRSSSFAIGRRPGSRRSLPSAAGSAPPARETRDVVQAGTDTPASLASQVRSRALSTLPMWLRGNASTRSTRVGQYHSVMPRPDR
jgi:hypothetical protein